MKFDRHRYRGNEADLVGEFYYRARCAGLEVFLEVLLPSEVHRSGEMRVDAVIVDGNDIVCCIEGKRPGRAIGTRGRQSKAYALLERDHGVQTIWINAVEGIDDVIADILWFISSRKRDAA